MKLVARWAGVALTFPLALLAGFGRVHTVYEFFAHTLALIPGLPGIYIRGGYYFQTLRKCALETSIGFGTYFAHPQATIGRHSGTGAYCVIGMANIGERVRIGTCVQILSGQHQHSRDAQGRFRGGDNFRQVTIGDDAMLGAACIVMEDIGPRALIGAGAVVGVTVPAAATVSGNPGRILRVQSDT